MSKEKNVGIIIPAYEEAANLELLLPNIHNVLKNYNHSIYVIDSLNKLDDTEEVCKKYHANYHKRKNGNTYGDAIRTGISVVKEDYTVIMDSDMSHKPDYIIEMLNVIDECDLVIGSRYVKGAKTNNSLVSKICSKLTNFMFKLFVNIKVKDMSNSFRLYKTKDLKSVKLNCNNFDIVEEILIKIYHDKFIIKEIPITFYKRELGKSKRKLVKFIISYVKTLFVLRKYKKEKCLVNENEV